MKFENFDNKNASVEHADGKPAFFEMSMVGFTKDFYESVLPSYNLGVSHFEDGEVDYISFLGDQDNIGKIIIEEYLKDKNNFLNLYQRWSSDFEKLMNFYYENYKLDFTNTSDEELLVVNKKVYEKYSNEVPIPGFIDGFMFYGERRLNDLVASFCEKNKINNKKEVLSFLTLPTEKSFLNEEEDDLKKIIEESELKKNISLADLDESVKNKFEEHLIKYSWIRSSYVGYKEYSISDLLDEANRIISNNKEIDFSKNRETKNEYISENNFSEELVAIIELSDSLIKWQDRRKQYTLTFITLKHKILEEISKRFNFDFDLISYSLNSELEKIISDDFDFKKLKERKEGVLFVHEKGELINLITGSEVDDFMEKVINEDVGEMSVIKGNTASLGIARGLVKVVTSVTKIDKVEDGDILVAPMTRPEYLAGMRKAAAIVTDDGGITCHAAIVSRELGIPCIIGTKIATKVLKDGDNVEVDADNGVINLLNN